MKFLKITLIIALSILVLIGAGIITIGLTLNKNMENAVTIAQQEINITPNWVEITTPLITQQGIILKDFKTCSPKGSATQYPDGYAVSTRCINDQCTATLIFHNNITPKNIALFHMNANDQCVQAFIDPSINAPQIVNYHGEIGINIELQTALMDRLINNQLEKTENSKFQNHVMLGFGNKVKISLVYTDPETTDEFLYGSVLFKVNYK